MKIETWAYSGNICHIGKREGYADGEYRIEDEKA